MLSLTNLVLGLFTLLLIITVYRDTRDYSIRYRIIIVKLVRMIVLLNFFSVILLGFIDNSLKIGIIIFNILFLSVQYALLKGLFRGAQTLADVNWLAGSSLIKGRFKWSNIDWKLIFSLNLFMFGWTVIVFAIGNPEINIDLLESYNREPGVFPAIYYLLTIALLAPIQEELVYRFFAVNLFVHWLGKSKIAIFFAVFIPTVVWVILHDGTLTNNMLKFIQVFPLGIVLGYLMIKKDLEHSILAHSLFNGFSLVLGFLGG